MRPPRCPHCAGALEGWTKPPPQPFTVMTGAELLALPDEPIEEHIAGLLASAARWVREGAPENAMLDVVEAVRSLQLVFADDISVRLELVQERKRR